MQKQTRSPSITTHFGGGKYMSGTPAIVVVIQRRISSRPRKVPYWHS